MNTDFCSSFDTCVRVTGEKMNRHHCSSFSAFSGSRPHTCWWGVRRMGVARRPWLCSVGLALGDDMGRAYIDSQRRLVAFPLSFKGIQIARPMWDRERIPWAMS